MIELMNPLPKLSNGATYGEDSNGNRVCTGSQMGRSNRIPSDNAQPLKMRLVRLRFVDGDYDSGGAYWGSGNGTSIYRGLSVDVVEFGDSLWFVEIFVRARNRDEAKTETLALLPNARFFN